MKYFKDSKGNIFAYAADGSQDEFIPDGLTPISEAEGKAIASPPPSSADLAAEARAKRDRLLSESDWIVTRSIEIEEAPSPEWTDYRKALRDLPEQEGFPQAIDWPTVPTQGV